jgi:hypothetical protein
MTVNEMIQTLKGLPHNADVLIDGAPVRVVRWHQQQNVVEVTPDDDQIRPDIDGSWHILYHGDASDAPRRTGNCKL